MKYIVSSLAILIALNTASVTQAQPTIGDDNESGAHQISTSSSYDIFKPKPRTDKRRLDYNVWDEMLANIVVDFGISSRIRATAPRKQTGTRIVTGHSSPYRLEGSRIVFGFLNENYKEALTLYRQDLVSIANKIDITRLSKDEQLTFWFNLHNVTLIEKIAQEYPEDVPSTLEFDIAGFKASLDDAKFINIRGVDLSLRNIREDIVFSNWSDPIVIYGFFRGDIGSPRMPRVAFTPDNLEYRLNGNANEFVNSLRGFHEARQTRRVSKIYGEAKKYFFPNWEKDLSAHIKKFAEGDTLEDFESGKPFEFDRYETKIADLGGGQRRASALAIDGSGNLPFETARLLSEVGRKQQILRRRGAFSGLERGYVIIEDIETDPDKINGETIK